MGDPKEEPSQQEIDQIMNEIQELQKEISDTDPLKEASEAEASKNVVNLRPDDSAVVSGGELSLAISGNMTLRIRCEFNGREVLLNFQDNCLCVKTLDGTEIKIPTSSNAARSVA